MEFVGTSVEAGGGGLSLDQASVRSCIDRIDAVSQVEELALCPVEGRFWWEWAAVLERRKGCLTDWKAEETDR